MAAKFGDCAPAIVLLNNRGMATATRIRDALTGSEIFGLQERVTASDLTFKHTAETLGTLYRECRPIIGLCATGILIRALAPCLSNKRAEPPVLAVSDDGNVIVPLLGGLTGANELAAQLADLLDGTPAITASGSRAFGIQLESPPDGYVLANPSAAKRITSDLLDGVSLRVEGDGGFIEDTSLPTASDGSHVVRFSIHDDPAPRDGLLYHPRTVVISVTSVGDFNLNQIDAACRELNIASTSIATIVVPEGTDLADATVAELDNRDISLRYGALPDDFKTVDQSNGLTVSIAPTPRDVARAGRARGVLDIVGVGPGNPGFWTRDVRQALAVADDLVGYDTYLSLVPETNLAQRRHTSGNRVEIDRAAEALDLAVQGWHVALITSGDPGIFAMASAVMEILEAEPGRWAGLDISVKPGISAVQTLASRIGAPIGHDFCIISLSDIRKPWTQIAKRLKAAAEGDFVIALYNPASKTRRTQIEDAKQLLLDHRDGATPVMLGRNLGRDGEQVTVTTLETLNTDVIDMRTIVVIGSSQTRSFTGPGGRQWVYSPRTYKTSSDTSS